MLAGVSELANAGNTEEQVVEEKHQIVKDWETDQ